MVFQVVEKMERETGIEPATNSLEGCDSTTELLPLAFVFNNFQCTALGSLCANEVRIEPLCTKFAQIETPIAQMHKITSWASLRILRRVSISVHQYL